VRFRKDASCAPTSTAANYRNALIARVKIMCDLDISERRKPQDGRSLREFRAATGSNCARTIPTRGLEDVVMRILPRQADPLEPARIWPKPAP